LILVSSHESVVGTEYCFPFARRESCTVIIFLGPRNELFVTKNRESATEDFILLRDTSFIDYSNSFFTANELFSRITEHKVEVSVVFLPLSFLFSWGSNGDINVPV
jgi:hypothetical protein